MIRSWQTPLSWPWRIFLNSMNVWWALIPEALKITVNLISIKITLLLKTHLKTVWQPICQVVVLILMQLWYAAAPANSLFLLLLCWHIEVRSSPSDSLHTYDQTKSPSFPESPDYQKTPFSWTRKWKGSLSNWIISVLKQTAQRRYCFCKRESRQQRFCKKSFIRQRKRSIRQRN